MSVRLTRRVPGQSKQRTTVMLLRTCALAFVATFSISHASYGASVEEIKARGYLSVATEDDYNPFEFVDNGKNTGYDNELLALVRKKIGVDVKQQIMPWSGILPGVTTGKYDMALTAVLVTDERKKTFDFASPTCEAVTFYATRKGSPIRTPDDLVGKVVGAETGSAMLADLKLFDEQLKKKHGGNGLKQIVEYQSYPEAYQDLGLGRVDAVANTQISLNSLVKTRPDTFTVGQAIGKPTYIAWAVKKGNTDVLKMVDSALLELRKSGEMYQLQQKWLGASYKDMPQSVN
ncbi:transporter substrate-binding domain-containing protein [Paraburkholderia silvatlantica]|uniref:Amino acid ABC transporter substrate-binding protein (PAAT family) n=1 Tax=Paraburkholderia silvatlantica TaxID=321895 RepID=A0A2U1A7W9_9BURK|nr:transporter substrate-binding domain-containing protein [Paraburkholderia silvatlantica]MBB2931184.1 polar amino acid transport system substrate-binding protein [Paraburkholderia silvatlantica]PVY28656.1 amino acid ABC transporter substrate-binding protein (PAAT family) [Paraburkholderia silvatlantica]PXW36293.1 amino acid ABC transporter substrate-binding protein (PAAT family) [Paraburkholderia silvatlantica]PYE21616.1 amino acid ABC transporter substrate-binding protein (PAAT family) [Para